MNRQQASALLAAIAAATIGCSKLLSNRCDVNSDCASQNCNMETKVCVPAAGGAGGQGGAGGSAGTGGTTFSCSECKGAKPICDRDASTCLPCGNSTTCQALDAGTNACVPADAGRPDGGATPGMCVDCLWNGDCPLKTKPICVSNTCAPCKADSDCTGLGPSVCMAGDGHCATDAETIYVQKSASCNDLPDASSNGGTKTHPFCSMGPALSIASPNRALVVVVGTAVLGGSNYANQAQPAQLTIVGQQGAVIQSLGTTPAFGLTSGAVSIRSVTFSTSMANGINAAGGTLNLDHVTVTGCAGGIFIDGAAFDIENTTVTGNTLGQGNTGWSGILINSVPEAGASVLNLDTVSSNGNAGIVCSGSVSGSGVLSYGNVGQIEVSQNCNFKSCGMGPGDTSASCGAQP